MNRYVNDVFYSEMDFFEEYISFCYQNCLRQVLKAKGIKQSHFYINTTASIQIKNNDYPLSVGKAGRGLHNGFEKFVQRNYSSSVKSKTLLYNNLELMKNEDIPLIVGVDTFYLPYTPNYMKKHSNHTIILCGYDLEKRKTLVVDWYHPWFFRGEMDFEDLLIARSSKNENDGTIFTGTPIRNNWARIYSFKEVPIENLYRIFLIDSYKQLSLFCKEDREKTSKILKRYFMTIENPDFDKQYINLFEISARFKLFAKTFEHYIKCLGKSIFEGRQGHILDKSMEIVQIFDVIVLLSAKQKKIFKEKTQDRFYEYIDEVEIKIIELNELLCSLINVLT